VTAVSDVVLFMYRSAAFTKPREAKMSAYCVILSEYVALVVFTRVVASYTATLWIKD
jgi:hypothetical protein